MQSKLEQFMTKYLSFEQPLHPAPRYLSVVFAAVPTQAYTIGIAYEIRYREFKKFSNTDNNRTQSNDCLQADKLAIK